MTSEWEDIKAFGKWALIAEAVGLLVGTVASFFHHVVEAASRLRAAHPWLLWLLPFAGLCIVWLYHLLGEEKDSGTNFVLETVRETKTEHARIVPLIFIGTALTHLCGGSSGREGAALQIGSGISDAIGRFLRLDEKDMHTMTMCGMAAAFAAVFGTPVSAAVFSVEVVSIGIMHFSALVPCVLASLTGVMTARFLGIQPTHFAMGGVPSLDPWSLFRVCLLAALCAFASIFFCFAMKRVARLYRHQIPNPYVRVFVGGCLVILLTLIVGSQRYNGAGMAFLRVSFEARVPWYAFLMKTLFTACTLGAGFKGGEIVPSFFVGATFGNVAARFLGLSPSFGAGLGLACLFCGVTNCPITTTILSVELFGAEGLPFFAAASAASYMLSGYGGLYESQKIIYSKTKAEYIDR